MSRRYALYVDSFEAVDLGDDPRRLPRGLTYETFRAKVLEAGEFSVFEATETPRRAALFEQLHHDPSIVCEPIGFPWTKVTRRTT